MSRRLGRKKVIFRNPFYTVALGLVAHHLAEVVCYESNARRAFGLVAQLPQEALLLVHGGQGPPLVL
jgi:hypothetical protein